MDTPKALVGPIAAATLGGSLILVGFSIGKTLILSLVVALFPIAWFKRQEWKERKGIEENLADFLRDLSESMRAGIPIYRGIETAAEGDYGSLTPYIRRMRWQIAAGISFEEVLERFAERAEVPRVERSVSLILRASRAGGKVADVMEAASERMRKHTEYSERRKSNANAYVAIAYVAFFVFIAVIYALIVKFFPAIAAASEEGTGGLLPAFEAGVYKDAFFYLAVAQAAATGIFAGKVGEGKIVAGIKHVMILIGVAFVFFFIV